MSRSYSHRLQWHPPVDFEDALTYRFWNCPACNETHVLLYSHLYPHPNLQIPLPEFARCFSCGELGHLPWPEAHTTRYKCPKCHREYQMIPQLKVSPEVQLPIVDSIGYVSQRTIPRQCLVCGPPQRYPFLDQLSWGDRLRASFIGDVPWEGRPSFSAIQQRAKDCEDAKRHLEEELSRLSQARATHIERQNEIAEAMRTVENLLQLSPHDFEDGVAAMYKGMGFEVYWTPKSADHGIDLVLQRRKKATAVQCKRYKRVVREPTIREFYGSFKTHFEHGIFVTSSSFTKGAMNWASHREDLTLIDGIQLAKLMTENEPAPVLTRPVWRAP